MLGLAGNPAVVTGAGQGIGKAVAKRLAAEGMSVLATDLRQEFAEQTAAEIHEADGTSAAAAVDIRRPADVDSIPRLVEEAFGRPPAVVVANAGYQTFAELLEISESEWRDVFDVNARGTYLTLRAAMKAMTAADEPGAIVTIASLQARVGSPYYAHYSASKAAVLSLSKSFALRGAAHNVRVNCVAPGIVETELWDKADLEMARLRGTAPGVPRRERVASVPLKRAGTPEDVAAAVAFLASNDAAYITGECLHVCGGDLML